MAKRKPLLDPAARAFIRGEAPEENGYREPGMSRDRHQHSASPAAAPPAAPPSPRPPAPAAAAPPSPRPAADATIRFTLDLDPEQHRRLRVAAAERGVRMSVIAREALDQWLSNS